MAASLHPAPCELCGQQHAIESQHNYAYAETVDEDLLDPITHEPLLDAVQLPCGHTFSRVSVMTWLSQKKTCPLDNKKSKQQDLQTVALAFRSILDKLKVACPNNPCSSVCARSLLPTHLRECLFSPIVCQGTFSSIRCAFKLARKDEEDHLRHHCPARIVPCPLGCPVRICASQLSDHLKVCQFKLLMCANKCGLQVRQADLRRHHKRCPKALVQCNLHTLTSHCPKVLARDQLEEHKKTCEFRTEPCAMGCGLLLPVAAPDGAPHSCVLALKALVVHAEGAVASLQQHVELLRHRVDAQGICICKPRALVRLVLPEPVSHVCISGSYSLTLVTVHSQTITVWLLRDTTSEWKRVVSWTAAKRLGSIFGAAINRTGKLITVATNDGSLPLLCLQSDHGLGYRIKCVKLSPVGTPHKHTSSVLCVAFDMASDWLLVSGSDDFSVRLWHVGAMQHARLDGQHDSFVRKFRGHTDKVLCVALNRHLVVSGSADKTVRVWDRCSGACKFTLTGHARYVSSVAINRCGMRLAAGSADRTLRVWDLHSGRHLATMRGHTGSLRAVFFRDETHCLTAADDRTLRLWAAVDTPADSGGAMRPVGPFDIPQLCVFAESKMAISTGATGAFFHRESKKTQCIALGQGSEVFVHEL